MMEVDLLSIKTLQKGSHFLFFLFSEMTQKVQSKSSSLGVGKVSKSLWQELMIGGSRSEGATGKPFEGASQTSVLESQPLELRLQLIALVPSGLVFMFCPRLSIEILSEASARKLWLCLDKAGPSSVQ